MPIRYRTHIAVFLFLFSFIANAQREISESHYNRADTLVKQGKLQEAIEPYQLFLDMELSFVQPDYEKVSEAYNNIGVAHYMARDYEGASEALEEALKIDRLHFPENVPQRLSNLGIIYKQQGYYQKAIEYYQEALALAQERDTVNENIAKYLNNIGIIYDLWSKYDKAIDYYERSLRLKEQSGDQEGIANSLNNIGMVYYAWEKYDQAIQNFREALNIDEQLGKKASMAIRLNNIGLAYYDTKQYDSALYYYKEALGLNIELGARDQIAAQYNNIGMLYFKQQDYDTCIIYLEQAMNIYREQNQNANVANVLSNLGFAHLYKGEYEKAEQNLSESNKIAGDLNLRGIQKQNYDALTELYEKTGQYDRALNSYRQMIRIKDSIFTEESREQIADFEVKYETERKQREIELGQIQLKRQRTVRNSLIAGLVLIFILAGVIYWALRQKTRSSRIIERERVKSDRLLLNILPQKVAGDLKEQGFTTPESFDHVTIFFSDLVNFTQLSSELEPQYIIDELNQLFTKFDEIMQQYRCERIKTIGDAYMAVCGLPLPNADHARNIVQAAADILQYMKQRSVKAPVKWQIRIGVHSGSVVAGVVGVKKYIYDVFGDAVNTAARMEQHSEPMRVNVSEATYDLTREHFTYDKRDPIDIKGKGMMGMWYLEI